jgi:hypothetical protein
LGAPDTQTQAAPSPWAAIQFLVGEWQGESEGQPGKGTVKRTYDFVLGDKFLHERNVSSYPPQPKNEKGEIHHHWSFFSYEFVETFELASGAGAYEVYSKARFTRVRRP